MEDETSPLNSTEDVANVDHHSSMHSYKESVLKIQILELYKSVDIQELQGIRDELTNKDDTDTETKKKTKMHYAFSAPTNDIDDTNNNTTKPTDANNGSTQNTKNELYGKQIQLVYCVNHL